MKKIIIIAIGIGIVWATSCTSSKKSTTNNTTANVASKPKNGVYQPGNEELSAIQKQFPEMSMGKLQEGYSIYTGACTKCHGTKNIYKFSVAQWDHIIAEMAPKARLNELQKDAVHKYVLAIKASQNN